MGDAFNYDALIVARESRGRTQAETATATGASQGLISKAENGLRPLSRDLAEKVAEYLEYPVELFYESGPIREGRSNCPYHHKRKTLPARTLNLLDGRMAVRLINVRHLLNGLDVVGERSFHTLDPDEFGGPARVAQALRQAWRVPSGPIGNLVVLIESAGGIVVYSSFNTPKLFGMSQWTSRDNPLFLLNADIQMEELRWTIAHELGHLVMHGVPTSEDLEVQADEFAAEFLMPRAAIYPDLMKLSFGRLPALKLHWKVSMKSLITRAKKTGALEEAGAVRLYKQYSARRWTNAEPYPIPVEPPTLVQEAVRVHLKDHGYSQKELATAVRLSEAEFERELLGAYQPDRPALSVVRD